MTQKKLSLRNVAQRAEIPSGRLSEILSGKRPLTLYYLNRLVRALKLNASEKSQMLAAMGENKTSLKKSDRELANDEIALVTEWYYFAILNLIKTKNFQSDAAWIADRLGLTQREVTQALHRLQRLDLIQIENGRFVRTAAFLSTTTDIPSSVLQAAHANKIAKAMEIFPRVPVEFRDISSVTLAIEASKVPLIKEEIRRFRKRIADKYEGGEPDEVYNMAIQFVPYTRKNK
jgi:uncharacterized protein (TIGR02147 family)